jgi:DNA-binding beta-propeller fold protein YncE
MLGEARAVRNIYVILMLAFVSTMVGIVSFCGYAYAARGHECLTSFGSPGSGNAEFASPQGVAVNEGTGRVYVVDEGNSRVEFYSSTGVYEGQFTGVGSPLNELVEPENIAVDNSAGPSAGDVYVTVHNAVDKFTASGEYLSQLTEAEKPLGGDPVIRSMGVSVDFKGDLWIAYSSRDLNSGENHIAHFSNDIVNSYLADFKIRAFSSLTLGFAVDNKGVFYVKGNFGFEGNFEPIVEQLVAPGITLGSKFAGELVTGGVAVESRTDDVYVGQAGRASRFDSSGHLIERLGVGSLVSASGIAVDSATSTVFVADAASDLVEVCPLEPPKKPSVEDVFAHEVSSSAAAIVAEVNPRGAPTTYSYEYGVCASIESCQTDGFENAVVVPGGVLGSSFEVSRLSLGLRDLAADTVYHARVSVSNQFGLVHSEEIVFLTQRAASDLGLLDGRRWELVSPPDAHGAQIGPIAENGLVQAASDGNGIGYVATNPVEPRDSQGLAEWSPVISSRGVNGWVSSDVGMPHKSTIGAYGGLGQEFRFFSEDLGVAIMEPTGPFSMPEHNGVIEASPEPTERTPYLRHNLTCHATLASCFVPLVTAAEDGGDVTSGVKFGGSLEFAFGDANFVGGTPDASHVVVASSVRLTEASASNGGLYEWDASRDTLVLVSVLPMSEGGSAAQLFRFGGNDMERDAISADGRYVFFTARAPGQSQEHVYVRDVPSEETVRLDVAEGGSNPAQPGSFFQTASSDGSKVFFESSAALTGASGTKGSELYECAIVRTEGVDQCVLHDLTPKSTVSAHLGESADVQGTIPGVSADGGYVYFVANGALTGDSRPGNCGGATLTGEECNLYVRHNETTAFVARLSTDDAPDWATDGRLGKLTSRVSPNGQWFSFMSDMPLTGYNNKDVVSGQPDEEVYLYDYEAKRLTCVSCNPSNGRPLGKRYSELNTSNGNLAGGDRIWKENQWLAANIPGWTPYRLSHSLHQSRFLSDSGRLFFDSSDALVPGDTNGNVDVYEFEPAGVGPAGSGCGVSSSLFVSRLGGCVDLVSGGLGFAQSAFLDASTDGSDVFFLTSEKLSSGDPGSGFDIYDAHECTDASPCAAEPSAVTPECVSAAACRAEPLVQPDIFGAPSSVTFSGKGNIVVLPKKKPVTKSLTRKQKLARALKACGKKRGRKRSVCERSARKRFGPKKTTGHSRKGGR